MDMKNILGILGLVTALLLASCSQTPTPTQDLESLSLSAPAIDASATASGLYVLGGNLLQKFDFNGNPTWSKSLTSGFNYATGIAIGANTVYVSGNTSTAISDKGFLRAYNESGAILWTKQVGNSTTKVRTNSAGNALVLSNENLGVTVRKVTPTGVVSQLIRKTGYGTSDFTLDTNGNIFILATQNINGGLKAFILKYNSAGTLLSTTFVDWYITNVWSTQPTITSNGTDIYVSYQAFSGGAWIRKYPNVLTSTTVPSKKINLPNTEIATMKVSGGFVYAVGVSSADAVAKKYDGNLNQLWSKQLGTSSNGEIFQGLATRSDAIYPVGYIQNSSGSNGLMAKLSTTNGSIIWSR
jgi:hypothetical protein